MARYAVAARARQGVSEWLPSSLACYQSGRKKASDGVVKTDEQPARSIVSALVRLRALRHLAPFALSELACWARSLKRGHTHRPRLRSYALILLLRVGVDLAVGSRKERL